MGYGHVAESSGRSTWRLRCLLGDEHGGVAVYAAIVMPLFLGSIGLGVDVGLAYSSRQAAQHQADAAPWLRRSKSTKGKTTDEVEAAATSDAEDNGFIAAHGDRSS